jgi:O-antigen biosynthesis protein
LGLSHCPGSALITCSAATMSRDDENSRYRQWRAKHDDLRTAPRRRQFGSCAGARSVAVLLVVSGLETPDEFEVTLRSLRAQTHPDVRVYAVCGEAAGPQLRCLYEKLAFPTKLSVYPGSPRQWLTALRQCDADLIAAIWVGDELRPWTCADVAECSLVEAGPVDLVYADHDCLNLEGYADPMFKPGWSPVFLRHCNYIGESWFISRHALHAMNSRDLAQVGSGAHSVLIELSQAKAVVAHIPSMLFSLGRNNPGRAFPPEAMDTQLEAVGGRLPRVSVIVPTRVADDEGLRTCLTGVLERTSYPELEIIVVPNNLSSPGADAWLHALPVRVVPWRAEFNWSAINNFAATRASGEMLLFLNDDVAITHPDWLSNMVLLQRQTGAAASGPLLTYHDLRTQHAGINFVYHGGGAQHLFRGCDRHERNAQWLARYPREVSAITGACMLVNRSAFEAVGGFDESFAIASNDTDFCIRLGQAGMAVLINPTATLIHHEGISRAGIAEMEDVLRFWSKWEPFLRRGDPFWNPNLAFDRDNWVPDCDLVDWHLPRIAGLPPDFSMK